MPDVEVTASEVVRPVPYLLEDDEGETVTWFGDTATVKISGRGFDVAVVSAVGAGDGLLPRRAREDVALFVLDGELVADAGDETFVARTGCFLFLPRGVRHTIAVRSGPARVLVVLGSPEALARHAETQDGARGPPGGSRAHHRGDVHDDHLVP